MGLIRLRFILVAFCASVCLVEGRSRTSKGCGLRVFIEGKDQRKSIVGGTPTVLGYYPWMVSLQKNSGHYCGGVIIGEHWVVTAAHCFDASNKISDFAIYAGAHKLSSKNLGKGDLFNVSKIIVHENYSSENYYNDIALVRTVKSLNRDDGLINSICLSSKEPTGMAVVAGWGYTQYKGKGTDVLHEVEVPLVSRKTCAVRYGRKTMPESVICAGTTGKDSCQGDSGGPLMQRIAGRYTLIGTVSNGADCGSYIPGIYMKVSAYLDWMNAKMAA